MKILFISSANSGNISPIVRAQGQSLEQEGLEVIYYGIEGKGFVGYLNNIMALRRYIRLHKPDLLHAHYGLSAIVALIAKGSEKVICSFMGDDLLGSNNYTGSVSTLSKVLIKLNVWLANHKYVHNIVKSDEMSRVLKSGKYSVIPNGVNTDFFKPVIKSEARHRLGLQEVGSVVLFVSNPARPEKNFALAEASMRYVKIKDCRLIPVYDIDHKDIPTYMNAGDVLLLTSFHEGSPNVVKEAMACNRPVVTTNVGDVEQIIDPVTGCFLSSYDPEDVGLKLNLALEYTKAHRRTAGRERIFELGLDSKSTAKRIIGIYNKVLE